MEIFGPSSVSVLSSMLEILRFGLLSNEQYVFRHLRNQHSEDKPEETMFSTMWELMDEPEIVV